MNEVDTRASGSSCGDGGGSDGGEKVEKLGRVREEETTVGRIEDGAEEKFVVRFSRGIWE